MTFAFKASLAGLGLFLFLSSACAQEGPAGILDLGEAVVTGFSGTVPPDPLTVPDGVEAIDETLIDLDGISARILDLAAPGFVWDGGILSVPETRIVRAREIGQVFGVTLDDAEYPNIYLTATSAYGLPIVAPDNDDDGRPERLAGGTAQARFMDGLWGPGGGPGSIWKVDGVTGAVSLFAEVKLGGIANPGPALGNITYDTAHAQFFVSDRATGMIHRFGLDGTELEIFDHGIAGRSAAGLPAVPYDPAGALDITRGDFDTEDPDSWGFAAADRQVWGLAAHDGRLYYAVLDDSQIWSVGIDARSGALLDDPRWEIDVPKRPSKLPVSDIVFTHQGAMILAQRGEAASIYPYDDFAETGEARVYRYWLESPDDPTTPSRWIAVPEEYAIGFGADNRRGQGGIDIGYGYGADGLIDLTFCEASLLSTGDNLRLDPELADMLLPAGPLAVDGLQVGPAWPVKPENTPPWASYMVDSGPVAGSPDISGYEGDVAVYRRGCGAPPYAGTYGGAGYPDDPPYVSYPEDKDNPDNPELPEEPELPENPDNPDPTCLAPDCPMPDVEIGKTCQACTIDPATGRASCQCQITVTSNGVPFAGDLVVDERMSFGSSPANQTIVSVGSNDPWTCDQPPFAPADPAQCRIDWDSLSAAGNVSTVDVGIELASTGEVMDAGNCAVLMLGDDELDQACTDLESEETEKIDVSLAKTWQPGAVAGAGRFVLTITNVADPFDSTAALSVTDAIPADMTITAATAADWTCLPVPTTGPASITCQYTGSGIMATGATSVIALDATIDKSGVFQNCASVAILPESGFEDSDSSNNESCVTVSKDGDFEEPDDDPDYDPACGTNVIFVVDESRSIADASATYYINNALQSAAAIFNANGAQAAVVRFSDNAVVSYPMATGTFGLVMSGYDPTQGGGTNWEAALRTANSLLPSPNTIIVFITDGTPTAYLDNGGAVVHTANSILATNEAIAAVNLIYAQGTPIVGIGIGGVSTHLNALLGTGSLSSSYAGLADDLTALAREACPDLYLTKAAGPNYINVHGLTAPIQTTVTLSVTSTATTALTNITVQDALPAELVNPANFSQPATVTGNVVSWTIASLAPGATDTLTFQVTVSPTSPPPEQWRCFANFAQVTAVDGQINAIPGNMASAQTGPVHEHDEAAANICLRDKGPNPPSDCGSSYLWVTKKTDFPEVCVPGGSPACSFTITVKAQCKDFNGPVLFGDGVSNAGTGVPASISSIANNANPTLCDWPADWSGTSMPTACLANLSLPVNQSVTFNVTLGEPLAAGSGYRNCFVADGKPNAPADYAGALADVNPTTAPTGGAWGNCAPFSVAGPPLPLPRPPQPNDKRAITCNAPAVPNAEGTVCVCPRGTVAQGKSCVTPDTRPPVVTTDSKPEPIRCNAPAVPNQAGTACVCPRGTIPMGASCVTLDLPVIKAPEEPRDSQPVDSKGSTPRKEAPAAPAPAPSLQLPFGGLFGN